MRKNQEEVDKTFFFIKTYDIMITGGKNVEYKKELLSGDREEIIGDLRIVYEELEMAAPGREAFPVVRGEIYIYDMANDGEFYGVYQSKAAADQIIAKAALEGETLYIGPAVPAFSKDGSRTGKMQRGIAVYKKVRSIGSKVL